MKIKWSNIYLKDLLISCDSGIWGNDPNGTAEDTPVIRVADINELGEIRNYKIPYRHIPNDKRERFLLRDGDLVVVKSSGSHAKIISGRTAIIEKGNADQFVFSNFLLRLRPNNKVLSKYLWFYLNSPQAKTFIKAIIGPTTYPNLKAREYLKMPIPLPDLSEQKCIVKILEKVNTLRKKRLEAEELSNKTIQSIFLQMFGEPTNNTKGWEKKKIVDVLAHSDYGISKALSKESSPDDGPPVLRIANITANGYIDYSDLRYHEVSEKKLKQLTLLRGDLLFNWRNSPNYVGKTAIFNNEGVYISASFLFRIRVDQAKTSNIYLWFLLNMLRRNGFFESKCRRAVSQANFNGEELKEVTIPVPPLSEQQKFADLVQKVEKIKEKQQESKEELDNLFNSLMQKYFS